MFRVFPRAAVAARAGGACAPRHCDSGARSRPPTPPTPAAPPRPGGPSPTEIPPRPRARGVRRHPIACQAEGRRQRQRTTDRATQRRRKSSEDLPGLALWYSLGPPPPPLLPSRPNLHSRHVLHRLHSHDVFVDAFDHGDDDLLPPLRGRRDLRRDLLFSRDLVYAFKESLGVQVCHDHLARCEFPRPGASRPSGLGPERLTSRTVQEAPASTGALPSSGRRRLLGTYPSRAAGVCRAAGPGVPASAGRLRPRRGPRAGAVWVTGRASGVPRGEDQRPSPFPRGRRQWVLLPQRNRRARRVLPAQPTSVAEGPDSRPLRRRDGGHSVLEKPKLNTGSVHRKPSLHSPRLGASTPVGPKTKPSSSPPTGSGRNTPGSPAPGVSLPRSGPGRS